MKFICSCETIRQEIAYANNFSAQKNSLAIQSNVLLETSNDVLSIKTTDGKMGFTASLSVQTLIPGSTTFFCDKLLAVLNTMPNVDIEFDGEEKKLTIKPTNSSSNNINVNLKTIDATNFPELLNVDESMFFTLPQKDFNDMVDKTSFAVAEDQNRKYLTGVYLEKKDDKLNMVATDGRRLAFVYRSFEQEIPEFMPAIIPVKFLQLLKTVSVNEGIFSLAVTPSAIFAQISNRTIYSSLIADSYPNYERVIPKELKYTCKMKTEDMEKSIQLISILAEDKSKRIFVDLNTDGIMVSGENNEYGDSKQVINCEYSGPEARISFNSNLILVPIKKIDSEFLKISFNTATAAMVLSPEPDKDYLYVLMPMQV